MTAAIRNHYASRTEAIVAFARYDEIPEDIIAAWAFSHDGEKASVLAALTWMHTAAGTDMSPQAVAARLRGEDVPRLPRPPLPEVGGQ